MGEKMDKVDGMSKKSQKILMLTPELAPYAQTGGLGDMVASLSKALAAGGHEVRVFMPRYGHGAGGADWEAWGAPVAVHLSPRNTQWCRVWTAQLPRSAAPVKVHFLEFDEFFGDGAIYTSPARDGYRFAFQSLAALDFCLQSGWVPDVVHAHDWTAALAPVLLNTVRRTTPLRHTAPVLTVHNLQHQGLVPAGILNWLSLPHWLMTADNLECFGSLNLLKGGLFHAAKITTVSPTYANEIQTGEFGWGLDPVLRHRAGDLAGVLNGIDEEAWDARTDGALVEKLRITNYELRIGKSAGEFAGALSVFKQANKAALRAELGLDAGDGDAPLFGVVSRLYSQKGLDLFADVLDELLANSRLQVVVLGSGDRALEGRFLATAQRFPQRCAVRIGFDAALSRRIYAASDFFVMPSRFEPCGLSQLYAMRYGALPIVRRTGGLADTVTDLASPALPAEATGIVFDAAESNALRDAVFRALRLYFDAPAEFARVRENAARSDFSWGASAEKYAEIYTAAQTGR